MRRAPFDVAKRVVLWLLCGLVMISGYGLCKLEPSGPPRLLPLLPWDTAVPFLPWTIWIYGTATWAALIAWLQVPDRYEGRRLFFSVALAACLCWIFFALWPTTYPRDLYPLVGEGWSVAELADLRSTDSPSNCFPSQHVALAWALGLTWASFLKRWWSRPLPILWACAVTVCTLTTKQHYLVDLPPGFLIGVFAWAVCQLGIGPEIDAFWERRGRPFAPDRERDARVLAALHERVAGHQWRLEDIDWPAGPLEPLPPDMVRLINQVVYIEEIAGLNFQVLRDGATDPHLKGLYGFFADEERRHADGLRRVLALHSAPTEPPGLGNALVLDQFDTLDPRSDADLALIATSTPVFETFLDAGTIPFLQTHASVRSPAFDAFVERVCRDEAAHLATNWILTRTIARRFSGVRGLRLLLNPNLWRGMVAVPWMSLDVYSLAYELDYDFRTLLPAFAKLWRQHERYPELSRLSLWWMFRVFVVCGVVATWAVLALHHARLVFGRFWITVTRVTDTVADRLFGPSLLRRRGVPVAVRRPSLSELLGSD